MCNRYRNYIRKAGLEFETWGYEEFSETRIEIRLGEKIGAIKEDIYPDREALVARLDENGVLVPDVMRWGFPKVQSSYVTNVRNVASTYWKPWLKTEWRCLVPVSTFAEFSYVPPKGDRWFEHTDGETMCFAGIWRPWTGERGTKANPVVGEHRLFAFLTTTPNGVVKPWHEKAMPVVLERPDFDEWLTGDAEDALRLQRPLPDALMRLSA
ncbi:MAG: SOS response-associated peptidase family protein [Hyphomonadaceae bacterium]|nr:SOS response-associated peptidase family protein [Hyphomonadaceae bacterium]